MRKAKRARQEGRRIRNPFKQARYEVEAALNEALKHKRNKNNKLPPVEELTRKICKKDRDTGILAR